MNTLYQKKTQVSAAVTDDTYNHVLKEAARRGITVSELVRYYVEEGLNNPTPQELRRLTDRLTTIEGALKELYEMAVVNWSKVKKERVIDAPLVDLPWLTGDWDAWKKQLEKKGLVNKKTGQTAYEELTAAPDCGWEDDENVDDLLREMWKTDGSWTEEEEKEYQEKLRAKDGIKPREAVLKRTKSAARKIGKAKSMRVRKKQT